jgi:hypothetical protein
MPAVDVRKIEQMVRDGKRPQAWADQYHALAVSRHGHHLILKREDQDAMYMQWRGHVPRKVRRARRRRSWAMRLAPGEVIAWVADSMGITPAVGCGCRSLRGRMNRMGWIRTLRWLFTTDGRRWIRSIPQAATQ